jgi:hypothetical protein
MRNVRNNFQNMTRWFLLIGVLTGIFFSGGEGIQLLPFPSRSETTGNFSGAPPGEFYRPYSLSLHNSAGFSMVLKAKTPKSPKDLIGVDVFRKESTPAGLYYSSSTRKSSAATFFHTSIFLTSTSDRAPPTI